jgi:hypothetical protein
VRGFCFVSAGPATVQGTVTVEANSALIAAFGQNSSKLTVTGTVRVLKNGTAVLGCLPTSFVCFDDPDPAHPTLSSHDVLGGDLTGVSPLGIVVHDAAIAGDVSQRGGGGGIGCNPTGAFGFFGRSVSTAYEDDSIGGGVTVSQLGSCWLGLARDQIGGNVAITGDHLADPDAIEVLANTITGNLSCVNDTPTLWDSSQATTSLFPRDPQPNTVNGTRGGQCVLASPTTPGGPPGPGPF